MQSTASLHSSLDVLPTRMSTTVLDVRESMVNLWYLLGKLGVVDTRISKFLLLDMSIRQACERLYGKERPHTMFGKVVNYHEF